MPETIVPPPTFSGAGSVPSTAVSGLSSRQVLFGSPTGGIAQDAIFQYDTTNGRLGIGSSAPTARYTAIPSAASEPAFDWYTTAGVQSGMVNSAGGLSLGTTAPSFAGNLLTVGSTLTTALQLLTVAGVSTIGVGFLMRGVNNSSALFGLAGGTGQLVTGTTAGDVVFRADGNGSMWFAAGGSTGQMRVSTNGVQVGMTSNQLVGFYGAAGSTQSTVTTAVGAVTVGNFNLLVDALRLTGIIR